MARTTVAQLEERINGIDESLGKLSELMVKLVEAQAAQPKAAKQPKQDEDAWISKFPTKYGTAEQRIEYDKLVATAKKQREAVMKATGSKAVKAFIPVPEAVDRMPHSIRWTVTY